MTFLGGDPLLRSNLLELVGHATGLGLRTSVDTNGYLLDEATVLKLKDAGIGNINVSIDSADRELISEPLPDRRGQVEQTQRRDRPPSAQLPEGPREQQTPARELSVPALPTHPARTAHRSPEGSTSSPL